MCRFVAYHGPPMGLDELLYRPNHSIIDQSVDAQEREEPLNGDGWGVGWYRPDRLPEPALHRRVRPAWNDDNMRHVSPLVETPLFFAHVRAASPGLSVQQLNCHPFTGGSTGSSLGFVCSVLDHPLYVVTADCIASEKTASMRALGAEVEVVETPNGEAYDGLFADLRSAAVDIEAETGAYFTDQFNNTDQLEGYADLGRELLDAVPDLDEFVMTVGTGGSAMGIARYLRQHGEDVTVTLVEPEASPVLSAGEAGPHGVQGTAIVGSPPLVEATHYDQVCTLPEADGKATVRELSKREGLLVGTSTGMNVAAAQRVAADRDPDDTVVTVACDTGLRYLSGGLYEGLEGTTFSLE